MLATGGYDGTARLWLWDPATAALLVGPPLGGHTGPVEWGSWGLVAGQRLVLATGGADGTVRLWDTAGVPLGPPLTGHTGPVEWGSWGQVAGRPVLATGGDDGPVRAVAYPPRDATLATGGDDGTVRIWHARTGQQQRELTGHAGRSSRWPTPPAASSWPPAATTARSGSGTPAPASSSENSPAGHGREVGRYGAYLSSFSVWWRLEAPRSFGGFFS